MHTPKRSSIGFDFLSSSVTASTAASRSKMNRAASICNINEHYDSFTSLNSKATMPIIRTTRPAALFGGSLMNINLLNKTPTQQQRSSLLLDDPFESPLTGSFSSLAFSSPSSEFRFYAFVGWLTIIRSKNPGWLAVIHICRPNRINNRSSMH